MENLFCFNMFKMLFLGLGISMLYFELAFASDVCLSQTTCRCVLSNNTIIDLSSVGSTANPSFNEVQFDANCTRNRNDLYSYNPCFPFNSPDMGTFTKPGHAPCTGASACVKSPGGTEGQTPEEHAIGLQSTATFGLDLNGTTYYIRYTVPGSNQTLKVLLICDESSTTNKLGMDTPECRDEEEIILTLTSKCACPDGCPNSIPSPETPTGLSTGSKILIAFFTILLAYLLVGIVWNYCNGSQGVNLIPNIEFWNDLPTLIMEGVGFVCSCCVSKRSYGEV